MTTRQYGSNRGMTTAKEPGPPRKRARLAKARRNRGWGQARAAIEIYRLGTKLGYADDDLGVDAHAISRWERGIVEPSGPYVRIMCMLYGLPAEQLDLAPFVSDLDGSLPASRVASPTERVHRTGAATMAGPLIPRSEDDDMKRREFNRGIIGSLLGALSLAEWERLVRPTADDHSPDDLELLSHNPMRLRPGRINPDEAAELERMVRTFERWDAQSGGARWRKAVVGQLRAVVDLHSEQYEPALRDRMLVITARLAQLSGWTAYDSRLYRSAHQYYVLALQASDRADSGLLRAKILGDMSQLADALGRHDDELRLVNEALMSLSPTARIAVRPELLGLQARAYAEVGRELDSQRAIADCIDVFTGNEPVDERPHYFDHAEVDCLAANAYIELALNATQGPQLSTYIGHAERHAARALAGRNPAYVRSRVLDMMRLAYVRLIQRDPAEAGRIATEALDLAADVSSARVLERMLQFAKRLRDRFPTAPTVIQFDDHLRNYLGQRADINT